MESKIESYIPYLVYTFVAIFLTLSISHVITALRISPTPIKKKPVAYCSVQSKPAPPPKLPELEPPPKLSEPELSPERVKTQKLEDIKAHIRTFFTDDFNLSAADNEVIDSWSFESKSPHPYFENWDTQFMKYQAFDQLCNFGYKLLVNLIQYSTGDDKYLPIIENILQRAEFIIDKNPKLTKYEKLVSYTNVTTIASLYQLITNKSTYHQLITRLVPQIPDIKPPKDDFTDRIEELCSLSPPRLLSNFMNSPEDFLEDLKSPNLKKFESLINSDGEMAETERIHQDGAAFDIHGAVSHGSYLRILVYTLKYADLYSAVYSVLQVPGNYYAVLQKLAAIVFHPKKIHVNGYPYVGYETQKASPRYTRTRATDVQGELGCHLVPSAGIAVLKIETAMFVIRVQMPELPTYSKPYTIKITEVNQFHQAQLRMIWFPDEYPEYSDSNLGYITQGPTHELVDFPEEDWYAVGEKSWYSYSNYVGRLVDKEVIFWKMKYEVKKHNYKITEYGMFSAEGLKAIYFIDNQGDDLYFEWRDMREESRVESDFEVTNGNIVPDGKYLKISNGKAKFKWIQKMADGDVDIDYVDKLKLTVGKEEFFVEELSGPHSYAVKRNDKIVAIGGPSSKVKDVVRYNGVEYQRNETMMYVKK